MNNFRNGKIVIIGGGNAGLSAAKWLSSQVPAKNITIIDPSKKPSSQPLLTLVRNGVFPLNKSSRVVEEMVPRGTKWVNNFVRSINPEHKTLTMTQSNQRITYDYLIISGGIELNWDNVEGLGATIGKNGVASNYSEKSLDYTWECIQKCKSGNAIFTQPNIPITCAGVPQKIMWLAEETFRTNKVKNKINVIFVSTETRFLGTQKHREALELLVRDQNITTLFEHNIVSVDGPNKKVLFEKLDTREIISLDFEMIHVTPPVGPPDFKQNTSIFEESDLREVDKYCLQHNMYSNIFYMGDCRSIPISRTSSTTLKLAPVLLNDLIQVMKKDASNF